MVDHGMQQLRQQMQLSPNHQFNMVATVGGIYEQKRICEQKLMQYMSEWNSGPADNNISFWRNFVAKYYAPGSKRRFCMSPCRELASMSLQQTKEKWRCDICKEVSDKGFEYSFEEMAETFQKKFEMGMKELLSLGPGKVSNLTNGEIVIFYKNMDLLLMGQSSYRSTTGQLVVTFNTELKISQWNCCLCCSEEFISTTSLDPQIVKLTEILQVAEKYEESQDGNESGGDPQLEEKIMKIICEFAASRTSQVGPGTMHPQGSIAQTSLALDLGSGLGSDSNSDMLMPLVCQCVDSMNSPQNNFTERSRHKSNPTSDAMAVCGNPNSFETLERSLSNTGLEIEIDPHPRQWVTWQWLEVNTSNDDGNNTAPSNLAEEELLRQEHQRSEQMVDKIFAAKSLKDIYALIASTPN